MRLRTPVRTLGGVGFNNPDVPWREIERTLSGRRPDADPRRWWSHGGTRREGPDGRPRDPDRPEGADGGDSPAWSWHRPTYVPPADLERRASTTPYAELHCHSNFSFLDGASHPEELAEEAARLGLEALALTDHDGFYGVVRFAEAARAVGVPTVFGAELSLGLPKPQNGEADPDGPPPAGAGPRPRGLRPPGVHHQHRAPGRGREGQARLLGGRLGGDPRRALAGAHGVPEGGGAAGAARADGPAAAARELARLVDVFGADNVVVELCDHGDPLDSARNDALATLAVRAGLPLVATNNVHYAVPARRRLATALAAVRARRSLDDLAGWLPAAAGAHLRSGDEQARRFARWPGAVELAAELGRACAFDLALVAPQLPPFPCPDGLDEMTYLRRLVEEGAHRPLRGPGRRHPRRRPRPQPEGVGADRPRARGHRGARLPRLLPRGVGHRRVLPPVRHLLPGAGQRRQLGGLLRPRRHQRRRGGARPAVRAVPVARARRPAGHRHRHRERAAGRGDPARVPPPRAPARRPGGQRHQLPGPLGGARHGQGARLLARPAGRLVEADGHVVDRGVHGRRAGPGVGRGGRPGAAPPAHDIPDAVLALAREVERAPRHLGIHSGGMVICDRPIVDVCPVEWGRFSGRASVRDGLARTDGTPVGGAAPDPTCRARPPSPKGEAIAVPFPTRVEAMTVPDQDRH